MILNRTRETDSIQDGETLETKSMGIDPDSTDILMDFLSKNIYSDYEGSIVRECVSNAYDSHVAAGVEQYAPIMVRLGKTENNRWEFTVEDFGTGMDQEVVDNVISQYLKSTKRNSNSQLGQKGLGFKCPLAYTGGSPFFFVGRKNGVESKWTMYEAEDGNKIDTLYTKETTEKNAVKVIVPITNYNDVSTFSNKIREQLSYFKNVYVIDDYRTFNNDYNIYRNDLFSWSEINRDSTLHINLGSVYYPIDFKKLDISPISVPIAIKIGLDDQIEPTLSRESITYSPFAKKYLKEKIKEVADFFVTEYNKTTHYQTFIEAYNKGIAASNKTVKVNNTTFYIDQLLHYSSIQPNRITVEGLNTIDLLVANNKTGEMFYEYDQVGYYRHSYSYGKDYVWKKDKIWKDETMTRWVFNKKGKTVEVNQTPVGNIKSFLQDKYGVQTMFVKRVKERGLKKAEPFMRDESYTTLFNLQKVPKKDWREWINDWLSIQKELTKDFVQEFDIEESEGYKRWLVQKKEDQKAARLSPSYVSKSLNKQKGEVTIRYASSYRNRLKWDTFTKPIGDLHKKDRLTVYTIRGEIEKDLYDLYEYKKAFLQTIDFIQVNPTEKKHFTNRHNYIRMDKLKESRPFQRLATALYANSLLGLEPQNANIIYETFPKYKQLKESIETYVGKNNVPGILNSIKSILLDELKTTGSYDQNIYPELMEFKEVMDKFGFLSFMDLRGSGVEGERVIKNIVYVMLKNKKVTGKNIDEFQLVPKSDLCLSTVTDEVLTEEEELTF